MIGTVSRLLATDEYVTAASPAYKEGEGQVLGERERDKRRRKAEVWRGMGRGKEREENGKVKEEGMTKFEPVLSTQYAASNKPLVDCSIVPRSPSPPVYHE